VFKGPGDADQIDRFIREVAERWKNTSTELRCVQSLLEEVLTYWKRWNATYEPLQAYIVGAFEALKRDEEEQYEFFQDLSDWRERYLVLQDTVAFLVATSDAAVGQDLRDRFEIICNNWEQLFQFVEKYMHVGDVNRTKKDYQDGLDKLDHWLRKAESQLSTPQKVSRNAL
jgi:nesprin-1